MKSFMAKKGEVGGKWVLVDANGAVLGRMATKIAMILMGKDKPTYTPHVLTGDFVVVVNAEKVKVTGNKAEYKEYDYFTLYPGGHKYVSFAEMMAQASGKGDSNGGQAYAAEEQAWQRYAHEIESLQRC